jgi:hypothetical protein
LRTLLGRVVRRATIGRQTPSWWQRTTFTRTFTTNAWQDPESVSGPGSTRARGADFRPALLAMLDAYGIRSIVDAPCGDFNWMHVGSDGAGALIQ